MKIQLSSVMVDDQEKALKFYTEVLGFVKKVEFPVGDFKWITVVSPEGPDDIELALEPDAFPPAKVFKKALFDAGIPNRAFAVDNIYAEIEKLKSRGVVFQSEPMQTPGAIIANFDDTCGNLIMIYQVTK